MAAVFVGTLFLCVQIVFAADGPACAENTDCFPKKDSGSIEVPSFYVQCVDGVCACQAPCFEQDSENNVCAFANPDCMEYDSDTMSCTDTRKSQQTSFFLSVLFSWVGAANFYLKRLDLAIPQLALFILVLLGGGILRRIFGRRRNSDYEEVSTRRMHPILVFMTSLAPFAIFVWWVVDLIVFAQGSRHSKDGCPLRHDL